MAFPYSIGVLDDFNRADGAIGSNWNSWPSSFYTSAFTIVSNQARGAASAENAGRWSANSYGPDMGAYVTLGTNGIVANFGGIFIRADGSTSDHGYQLIYIASGNVLRIDVGGSTIATTTQALSSGDSIGIEAVGTAIKAHYKAAGGSWVQKLSVTDAAITAAGYAGMFIDGNQYYDDFAAGTIAGASPPVADFTGTPLSGSAPLSVAFTDTSTGEGGSPTFHWEKNDGSGWVDFAGTPTAQNPTESFS